MSDCGILTGTPLAVGQVQTAYDKYSTFATVTFTEAQAALAQIAGFTPKAIAAEVSFNLGNVEAITGFKEPDRVTARPEYFAFQGPVALPGSPDQSGIHDVEFADPPSDPLKDLDVGDFLPRTYTPPGALTAVAPDGKVDLQPLPTADAPDVESLLPEVPTLLELDLPEPPADLTVTPFDTPAPDVSGITVPVEDWSFTPQQFTDALLDKTKDRVSMMLDGGTGLPLAIAQALRDRAFDAQDADEFRAVQQATEEYASKGWTEPSGILNRRVAEVRQQAAARRGGLSRDIAIEDQQIAIENLRFAVSQGVALESALMQGWHEYMALSLDAAKAVAQLRNETFRNRVALAQLELDAYKTAAAVWREELQAQLVELQAYREQLQAEAIKGQINQDRVALFKARIEGVLARVDIYKSQVAAINAVADTNRALVQVEEEQVKAYAAEVDAWGKEWDAYRTQLGSNVTRAQVYDTLSRGFGNRISIWSEQSQQQSRNQATELATVQGRVQVWEAQVRKILGELELERTRLGVNNDVFRAAVAKYSAEAQVEVAASDANLRAVTLGVEKARAQSQIAIENLRLGIQQNVELAQLALAKMQTVAKTAASLSAASMSAVNFSSHAGYGMSESYSHSYSCD
ncbi:MAG TPA: hypothetical protein VFG73_02275 [Rhodanobacteraceae bacterium]|nr:hypothetical protein [Rhodanobacteraceae bacterium]